MASSSNSALVREDSSAVTAALARSHVSTVSSPWSTRLLNSTQSRSRSHSSQWPSSWAQAISAAVRGPMAGPNTWVTDTKPSFAGYTSWMSIAPVRAPPAVREMLGEPTASDSTLHWLASIAASWAETSTCWPRPECCRSASAINVAQAATAEPMAKAWGITSRTGARSRSPLSTSEQDEAITVRSVAAQRALGPSWPKAEIEVYTNDGLIAARSA